jgi:hypothetical protein
VESLLRDRICAVQTFGVWIFEAQLELQTFEKKYLYTTQQFYAEFQTGELSDSEDFMIWAGLYEMWQMNQQNLSALQTND